MLVSLPDFFLSCMWPGNEASTCGTPLAVLVSFPGYMQGGKQSRNETTHLAYQLESYKTKLLVMSYKGLVLTHVELYMVM